MIRLLIVDDHDVVRMGLKQVFEDRVDMEVGSEARTGAEALDMLDEVIPWIDQAVRDGRI